MGPKSWLFSPEKGFGRHLVSNLGWRTRNTGTKLRQEWRALWRSLPAFSSLSFMDEKGSSCSCKRAVEVSEPGRWPFAPFLFKYPTSLGQYRSGNESFYSWGIENFLCKTLRLILSLWFPLKWFQEVHVSIAVSLVRSASAWSHDRAAKLIEKLFQDKHSMASVCNPF